MLFRFLNHSQVRFSVLAVFVGSVTSCADPIFGDNDLFCSASDQNRCYNAGCTDGDNSESPNAYSADCASECHEHYCDGYCDCEVWLWNEECSECM
jgi:hypothetical protein